MRKGWKRGHRLVVLPDYQGIGIGTIFHNYCAEIIKSEGHKLNSTTTTPALIHSMIRDDRWLLKRKGRNKSTYSDFIKYGTGKTKMGNCKTAASSSNRVTFSFNYK